LIGVTGKNIFGSNAGRVGLAGDIIGNIITRVDIITRVNITITT
jgi:hypothetical protein